MIFTGVPAWFIILCLILALGYAFGLYFRERKTELPAYLRMVLGIFRFLSVFTIAFLLLSPFIRSISREREKPVIVIAQDNSGSIGMNRDSTYYREAYLNKLDDLASSLRSKYNVKRYLFGESVTPVSQEGSFISSTGYDQELTDISALFEHLSSLYSSQNLGAVILSSDGVYNAGFNPIHQVARMGYPVYSIGLGDTAQRRDLILAHVAYNRMVYLDSKFPLRITLRGHDCEGSSTTLRVTDNGQLVYSKEIRIDKEDFTTTEDVILQAGEKGLKRYRVSLTPAGEEQSLQNNVKDVFIEVLDARNKILVLYHSPHPDVAALRSAAESNINYEVEEFPVAQFSGQLEAYNLVVLHQLPSRDNPSAALLEEIREKEVPVLLIVGTQTDLPRVNQWGAGLNIVSPRGLFEEALPAFNTAFSLFTLQEETRRILNSFPPLSVPSGTYQQGNMAHAMFYQRIGGMQTSRPLLLLEQNQQRRAGIITGEGIWRWRLMNYDISGNHDAFNELFNKIFQYLSLKEQKRNLRVYTKSSNAEYEKVRFDAELYNMNYELINEPELEMVITDEEGRQFPYTFSRSANAYHLDAGKFLPGNYSFMAKAAVGTDTFSASGQFSVSSVDLESLQLVADHELLRALSDQSRGRFFLPGELDGVAAELEGSADIKPVIYTSKKIIELISLPWLLMAILLLLGIEWFIRKRSGSY